MANLFQSTLTRSLKTGAIFKALFISEEMKHGGGGGCRVVWMGSTSHPGLLMGLNQNSLVVTLNLSCHDRILILLFIGQDGEEEASRGNSTLKIRPSCSPPHLGSQLPRLRLCRGGCGSASLPQLRRQAH